MSYAVGDIARASGNAPPFGRDELAEGCLTIAPATIYLGQVRWWEYTDDPKVLFCSICQEQVTNYYLAIDRHVRTQHSEDQI